MSFIEVKGSRRITQGDLWKFLPLPIQSYYFRIKVGILSAITTFKSLCSLLSIGSLLPSLCIFIPTSFPIFIPHQATTYFIYDKLTKLYKENIKLNLNKSKASKEMILKMKIMHNKKIYPGKHSKCVIYVSIWLNFKNCYLSKRMKNLSWF